MKHETRDEIIAFIKERANDIYDIAELIMSLESVYEFRACLVTRKDVEDAFEEAWDFEGGKRTMTQSEWEKFCSDWFWRKGHYEVMWDGVGGAIQWDLLDNKLLPQTAIVE